MFALSIYYLFATFLRRKHYNGDISGKETEIQ